MRKYYFIFSILLLPFFSSSQIDISKIGQKITNSNSKISEKETSKGLIEALKQGSRYAVQEASKKGGFNNNPLIRIPFPKEAKKWQGDYIISYLSRWIVPSYLLNNAKIASFNFHPASPEYPGIGCNNFALYILLSQ